MTTTFGIDLSHWNSVASWSPAGLGFVIVKASEGTTADSLYDEHMAKVKASGKLPGAYMFARDDVGIDAQAKFFATHSPGAYFLAVDNEGKHAMTASQIRSLIAAIRKYDILGRNILLYMSESGFFLYAGQDDNWVANWGNTPHTPYLIWQYLSGSQSGSGGEDRNRYEGTLAQLKTALSPYPVAPESDIGGPMPSFNTVTTDYNIAVFTNAKVFPNEDLTGTPIVVSPGRRFEYLGITKQGVRIIRWMPAAGDTTQYPIADGWSGYVDKATCGLPELQVDSTPYSQADLDEAKATQKAADQADLDAAYAAAAAATAKANEAQAAADKAIAEKDAAVAAERARIAAAEEARINAI